MVTEFKIGDKIAAAVLTYKRADLRVGVVEKIHPATTSLPRERYTIRDEHGQPHIVSAARSVHLERDEHHTMEELYEYRMVYHAMATKWFGEMGRAVKSWRHHDGELCFGGGWFIVCFYTLDGLATNHYKAEHWDLFEATEVETAPEWDGHTPAEALRRLRGTL